MSFRKCNLCGGSSLSAQEMMMVEDGIARDKAIIATYEEALNRLARLGNGEHYGNSVGNEIARRALEKAVEYRSNTVLIG